MYKLLLATDDTKIRDLFEKDIDWHMLGYHRPLITGNCAETVEALKVKAVDAVGYCLPQIESDQLERYLRYGRPSLPVFAVARDADTQKHIMKELIAVMDRLHGDYSDDYYDAETMMTMVRDEFTHQLLAGELNDYSRMERTMLYLRSRLDPEQKLVLFDIDLPQGEIYMGGYYDPALRQNRLESALRNNFFGRYVEGAFYAVAVLTPRKIRLAAIPMEGTVVEENAFLEKTRKHVDETMEMVKQYLELDMYIRDVKVLENMRALINR